MFELYARKQGSWWGKKGAHCIPAHWVSKDSLHVRGLWHVAHKYWGIVLGFEPKISSPLHRGWSSPFIGYGYMISFEYKNVPTLAKVYSSIFGYIVGSPLGPWHLLYLQLASQMGLCRVKRPAQQVPCSALTILRHRCCVLHKLGHQASMSSDRIDVPSMVEGHVHHPTIWVLWRLWDSGIGCYLQVPCWRFPWSFNVLSSVVIHWLQLGLCY